jgi:hypothetical protein
MTIDIRNDEKVVEAINAILSNNGIVECKVEGKRSGTPNLVVVEIKRTLKTVKNR